ncbi:hypothetical protein CDOO_11425 [Corynebacterium doosanense CAU 212 = DSM 45436]|uniref:CAAX protease n=1 Tax=Corynebacterium doosanense CAU 212 = DSM 45436 TaxID=558173 RepID=A0A097II46_9CORY|nr:hypothetical protein CDOO_11425 [Corynebacterium doosanense CAU 212 = DSM 45436]
MYPQITLCAVPNASAAPLAEVQRSLSIPRFSRYLAHHSGDPDRATQLYAWNADVSARFMLPIHFAEVSIRNAVNEALSEVYGDRWPWVEAFENSLPEVRGRNFKPREELKRVRSREESTGKVIAELKLIFWVRMFDSRHHHRLWQPHIAAVLPDAAISDPASLRENVKTRLDRLRVLRNRLSHHEPIFDQDLEAYLTHSLELVGYRSAAVREWVASLESVSSALGEKP